MAAPLWIYVGIDWARSFFLARMGRVLIYVTEGCAHCVRAKRLLDEKGVSYETVNLVEHPERREEMVAASNGGKTVPQIFFNLDAIGVGYLLP